MSQTLARHAAAVASHPWAVLAAAVAATATLASGAVHLRIDLDPELQLPAADPYVAVDARIREEFGGRNFVAVALVPASGTVWRRDVLASVHGVTLALLDAPGVIRPNVASLSSPYVRTIRDDGGVLAVDYLMREPPADDAGAAVIRDRYRAEPLLRGNVVSEDERAALVLADFHDDVTADEIAAAVERAVAPYRSAEIEVALAGEPIVAAVESGIVERQAVYFIGTIAAIVAVLWLAFGQLQGVVLPATTALLATACAMGFMGFVGIPMNPWTTAVPVVVVTIAAGHSAQMLKRYGEEFARLGERRAAVVETTRSVAPVMLSAGATAGSGFAALSVLGIPTLTQFGLGVASGIAAAVALEMTFMLALRSVWPVGRATEGVLSAWLGAA
ncbi:MAG: MMPL family transporter, partial [Candidatus Binatia bacterium]